MYALNGIAREQLEILRQFIEHHAAKRAFSAYLRIHCTYRAIIQRGHELRKLLFNARKELVDVIQSVRPTIGITKAVRILGMSRTTFQNWLLETKVKCNHSYLGWCNRIRPHQLSRPEVMDIRRLVTDQ